MDERDFVTYRGDHIPHPTVRQRYVRALMKDVPDDAEPDDVPPEIEAAIDEYYERIHRGIDARVVADMMKDPDPAWRCEGLRIAWHGEDASLVEPSALLLDDADPGVRRQAVLTVWHLRHAAAAPTLVRLLAQDPDEHVRAFSAWALGDLHTDGAVEALSEALRGGSEKVVTSAALALRSYNDARVIEPLLAVLQTDASWNTRYQVLRTLDDLGCRDQAMLSTLDWLESDAKEMETIRGHERSTAEMIEEDPELWDDHAEEPRKPYEPFDDVVVRLRREIRATGTGGETQPA